MNSETQRDITMHYNGKHSPLRVPVILSSNRLFPGHTYSYAEYQAGISNLSSTGLFSTVDVNFSPRDTTGLADTLDMHMNLVFDKPYDIYFEGNVTGKPTTASDRALCSVSHAATHSEAESSLT